MKTRINSKTLLALSALFAPLAAGAANVTLKASDANGPVTSLNGAGQWNNGLAPSAGNDYYTGAFFMRTPTDAAGVSGVTYTFGGNSLTLQSPNGGARSIIFKGAVNDVIVINNLTNALGGILENGGSGNVLMTYTGNRFTIAANSAVDANQGPMIVGYPLVGADNVVLTNAGGNAGGITYNANNSLFTGKFLLSTVSFGNGGGNTKVILNAAGSAPGNPATPTPDQILLNGGCTLQDNVGLTLNNANGGVTLAGSAFITAASTTTLAEPITDVTNGVHSVSSLTANGAGTLVLGSPNNTYVGGTVIASGTLQYGVDNAIPSGTNGGDVTVTGILDLNGHNGTINGLTGAGSVVNNGSGTPTLTVGGNGDGGTFTGSISGSLGLAKVGAGTETLSGSPSFSGPLLALGGSLSVSASTWSASGTVTVSNATVSVDNTSGNSLPVGGLTFLNNAVLSVAYGTVTANPANPAVNVSGSILATGTNIQINVTALGLKPGTITLIKYTGTPLSGIANFSVNLPPGVLGTVVNNTGNDSIDINLSSTPNQLAWNGVNGTAWNLTTPNWANLIAGGITVFQQYTNGSVVAGDSVLFDDTLTNDFVNPQPTNINLTAKFFAFPVVVNSTLPYTIAGPGGIAGLTTSLIKSNSGSLLLLTSNSFGGGVSISDSGSLIITNDSALGAPTGPLTLNGGTLQINGGLTNSRTISMPTLSYIGVGTNMVARLAGVISGAGASLNKNDNGTLVLAGRESFTGNLFLHGGYTVMDTGGSFTNATWDDVGQNGTDAATLTLKGTSSLYTTSDFNLGDLDSSTGTLNIQDSATLTANGFYVGSANAAGSTGSGIVNQTGGTITEVSTAVGTFAIGGRTSPSAVGVYNISGGTLTANAGIRVGGYGTGTLNENGGTIFAKGGINIARLAGSSGTNNLNGGVLSTYNVTSSTGANAIFNFNGGLLQANFSPPTAPTAWMGGLSQANILAGGAFIDSSNYSVTISQPLLAGSANGGLTKIGSGTLTLTGVNTFTGPITNNAGTLVLNSASIYTGGATVNGGTLQVSPASTIQGPTVVGNNATVSIQQVGNAITAVGNLTLNGLAAAPGAVLGLTMATNNPAVAPLNCGTLTLNGTNTISLAAANIGTTALVKYSTLAGSGNCTNLYLPQGASGYISNNAANSTLYVVITSTGPGLVWTGTNSLALNVWDINATTNWLVNATPTSYHQLIIPGDAVVFNDLGSGSVTLNASVSPASLVISNNSKVYTFSGAGGIAGSAGLLKAGSGTAILNLTNDTYQGNTTISNGALQVVTTGTGASLSPSGNLVIGASGALQLSAQSANVTATVGGLAGAGAVQYTGGYNSVLSMGGNLDTIWNGAIQDAGGGGLSVTKSGSGTWIVGGANHLNNSDFFNAVSQNQLNAGTTIITNNGSFAVAYTEFWIAQGAGSTSTVVVAGGTLAVSNNWLCVGRGDPTANGTLIVNSGTVVKTGANNIIVGSTSSSGTLIVNGGQIFNNNELLLGENATSTAALYLNGGLLQATSIRPNGTTPASSVAYFNGGTLQAAGPTNNFLQVSSMVMSNGLVLDDNGFSVTIASVPLESGDAFNGGLVKQGAGTVYLDAANTYTGATVVSNGVLAGIGSIMGAVVVSPAGTLGAGDAANVGTLTISGALTVQGAVAMRINKTGGSLTSDLITGVPTANYGGTLVVSNSTSDGTALANGDTFTLVSAGASSGNFATIAGTPGTGLSYRFNPASGVLSVVAQTYVDYPTNITASVSGNSLKLTWPADHNGWVLQVETNALGSGLSSSGWVDVSGSSSNNTNEIPINASNPAVFYRLRHP